MKQLLKRVTALVLTLAMVLSLGCVTAFAADVDYAHFEIGKVETSSLKTGDTVRIPLYIAGMKEGQYCGGFSANITLGAGLEWFETNAQCAEWTSLMSSFGSKFINHSTGLLTAVDYAAAGNGSTSCNTNGKVCDILCRVTDAYDGTNATIALSNVSISGTSASVFLNSSDGTMNNRDKGAIIFDGQKVGEGAPISAVVVPEYSIVAEADKTEVVAGDDVTVTVTVKGGEYVGAAVKLAYDSDKFDLKTAPESGWNTTSTGYAYYNVNQSGGTFAKDTVIGTFVFTAKALSAEANTVVTLSNSYVAQSFDNGWSTDPANSVPDTDASVTIKQDTLNVTEPTMSAITYDGQQHAFDAVTTTTEGATITYSEEEDGTYTSTIPTKKDAGTYTLYYKVEKLGYSTETGSYDMTISKRDVTITVPAQGKTFGGNEPALTYTVNNKVEGETFNANISRTQGETVGDYDITVTPGENPNYNVTENNGGTFTISAATIEGYTVDWADITDYNGQEHAVATMATAEDATAGVTITWKVNNGAETDTIPTIKNAGTYTVTYTIAKDSYTTITDTKTFNVTKAAVTITADNKTMTYGDAVPELTYQITSGTIYTGDDLDIQLSTDATSTSNTGDYDITVSYTPNDNYEVTPVKDTLTINPATITGYTITASPAVDYDEQAHVSATVTTGTPADATITYKWTENNVEQTSTTVPSFTNGGTYNVSYTISKANYADVTDSYTFTINSGAVEASAENVNVTYDGQPHSITVTVTKPQGTTISYRTSETDEWSTENPTVTDVTETPVTVYWKVSKAGYADKTGSNTITITKATMTGITVNAVSNAVYNGNAQAAIASPTIPTGATIQYSTDNGANWVSEIPSYTDAGTYTVQYKVTMANYDDVTGNVSFTIDQKAVTITVNNKTITLGDALPTFDGSVEGLVNDSDLGTITYTCPTFKQETGTYDIIANYTANDNYTVTATEGTLTVSAPTYAVEVIDEYVTGYHMILVYTNDATTFSYDDKAMYDVTSAGYKYGESQTAYNHVYAIVVAGAKGETEDTLQAKVAANMTAVAAVLDCATLDVNSSNSVDLNDAVAVVAVYNAKETYMNGHMPIVLKADVNHDKVVNAGDFGEIKAEYMK